MFWYAHYMQKTNLVCSATDIGLVSVEVDMDMVHVQYTTQHKALPKLTYVDIDMPFSMSILRLVVAVT